MPRTPSLPPLSALRHPGFRAYFLAAIPLVQALWAQRVTLGWLAWEETRSAPFVGLVAAMSLAPTIVAGPVFGVLVDRADIRRALLATTASMAALLALAALLAGGPGLGRTGLVAIAIGIGIVAAAHHPVRMSLAPRLVPQAEVPAVVALTALNFNTARMTAPLLAGLALVAVGPVPTLWVAAALYLPMILVAPRLDARALPRAPRVTILAGMRDGLRHLARERVAREALVLTAAMAVLVRGYLELLPVMAEGVHGRGPEGLGALTAAAGAGAVTAALVKTSGAGQGGIAPSTRAVLVLGTLALAGLGLSESWAASVGWTAALGFAATFCGVGLQAAVQETLPDALRGRVMSLWMVVGIGAVALGSGALGILAGAFGLPPVLLWAGLAGGILVAALALAPARGARTDKARTGEPPVRAVRTGGNGSLRKRRG